MSGSLNVFLICNVAIILCFHAPLKLFVRVWLCKGSASTFSIKALLDFRTVKLDIFYPWYYSKYIQRRRIFALRRNYTVFRLSLDNALANFLSSENINTLMTAFYTLSCWNQVIQVIQTKIEIFKLNFSQYSETETQDLETEL